MYFQEHDIDRTVGVYHDYIDTTDFSVIDADREFLIRVGRECIFDKVNLIQKFGTCQIQKNMLNS